MAPLRPGSSKHTDTTTANASGLTQTRTREAIQSENPASSTIQNVERTRESTMPLPANTRITETYEIITPSGPTPMRRETLLASPSEQVIVDKEITTTTIGAAQKDVSREILAKAQSLRPLVYIGAAMIVVGLVMIYFAWYLPGGISIAGGVGMIVLSNILVTNGAMIAVVLGLGFVLVSIYYAYHKGFLDKILPASLDHGAEDFSVARLKEIIAEAVKK